MTPRQKRLAMELRKYEAGVETALMKTLKKSIVNVRSSIAAKLAELGNVATNSKAREQAIQSAVDALERMQAAMHDHLKKLTETSAVNAHDSATDEMKESGKNDLVQYDPARSERYMSYLAPRNAERLAAVFTDKMEENLVRTLRFGYIDVARQAAVEGMTYTETNKALQERWQKDSGNDSLYRFVDKAGRAWENARYFQMLVRTNSQRVWTDSYADTLASNGFQLARISDDGDPDCPVCSAWEGRIVSVAGKRKGFPTYADAQEAGVFHPNCTHRLQYIDESIDGAEIDLQSKYNPSETSVEAMQAQKDKMDVQRKVNTGLSVTEAKAAVASERLERYIRATLFSDQLATVASSLPKDTLLNMFESGIPRFATAKKEDEPWTKRNGVLKVPRDATPEAFFEKLGGSPGDYSGEKPKIEEKPRDLFPSSTEGLKVVKELGGSTGAKLVEDAYGNQFVMKRGASPEHLRSECEADAAYIAAGVSVPEFRLYEEGGKPVKLSKFIPGARTLSDMTNDEREEVYGKLRKDFHVDVLLGNWDVLGLSLDNVLVDRDGTPWRIDNGGSLGFRAQGEKKGPEDWQAGWIDDLWSMRNLHPDQKRANKNLGAAFGKVTTVQIAKAIRDGNFDSMLEKLSDADRAVMRERLKEAVQIADRGEQFDDNKYDGEFTEKVLWHSYALSKEGLREAASIKVDENHFGYYRSGSEVKKPISETHSNITDDILGAVKTINYHLAKGDTEFNKSKIAAALSHTKIIEKAVAEGWQNAEEVLAAVKMIQDTASGNSKKQIEQFTATSLQPKPTPDEEQKNRKKGEQPKKYSSLTDHIHDYMRRNGADPTNIVSWQMHQSGHSWKDGAAKFKFAQEKSRHVDDQFTWRGEGDSTAEKNYKIAQKMTAIELKKWRDAKAAYQAGVVLCLENTEFDNNDRSKRVIRIMRTEDEEIIKKYGIKVGEKSTYKRGSSESHSIFKTVVVYGDCLTVGEVPYSNVLGMYMLERNPGSKNASFHSDAENEFVCDTRGIPFKYVGKVKSCHPLDKYVIN